MRIVLLAVDDEYAGEIQLPLFEAHPEWIVGSVISSRMIYKRSNFGAVIFTIRTSGFGFLFGMFHVKLLKWFLKKESRSLPSQLARKNGIEQFACADINAPESIAKLKS